jgi:hypothetical protein
MNSWPIKDRMSRIAIRFRYPSSIPEQELLSQRAVEKDSSVEHALCFEFGRLAESLAKPKGRENFFDLVFLIASKKQVISPKVTCSSYIENGKRMPMLILQNDYLISLDDSIKIPITSEMLDELGQIYQTEFDYEYVSYQRL